MAYKNPKQTRTMRIRSKLKSMGKNRLLVFRSNKSFYAQIIDPSGNILSSAATKQLDKKMQGKTKVEKASLVGELIGANAKKNKINMVVIFDRGPYKYHGRVKAFAESARKSGLKF